MARSKQIGLTYFPFDVDFFENEKIEALSGEFGIKGELAVIKLFCAIYKNGYYLEWNDLQKMKLLKRLPGVSSSLLDQIIKKLVKWELLNQDIFTQHSVMTSKNIQNQFINSTKRRKDNSINEYDLINVYINDTSTNINVDINTASSSQSVNKSTQSKVKESKVNNNTNVLLKKPTNTRKENFEEENSESQNSTFKNFQEEKEKSSAKKEKDLEGIKNFLVEYGAVYDDVSEWFRNRIVASKPTTRYVMEKFILECKKNNITVKEAVYLCAFNGWINFNPIWVFNQNEKQKPKSSKNGKSESSSPNKAGRVDVDKAGEFLDRRRKERELQSSGRTQEEL
ncbi:MAG: DUF4373 domain-containing protein [Chryseobacterium sp.]|uniref:DUF4373 domain-containing protein n=1 Tax=Chryseobacterium sp. TaxID=1871047 RepID=UPI001B2C721F|nr:DUF4373 domain-containing protein [Chryseobacterium sp.]MBO6184410.1 DUF4373 domain-containing protein [Chryseobacterium sp.]